MILDEESYTGRGAAESNIAYLSQILSILDGQPSNIKYIIHYKNQPMRKHINIFRKWRNIDYIFIK